MGFNPIKLIASGGKFILKGLSFVLNRPETSIAALILPGLGFAKAALILKYMMQAEDVFTSSGSGPTKLKYVMTTIRLLEKQGLIDLGLTDGELAKYIAALVPAAEERNESFMVEIDLGDTEADGS
jgi:hypothetical protein